MVLIELGLQSDLFRSQCLQLETEDLIVINDYNKHNIQFKLRFLTKTVTLIWLALARLPKPPLN